LFGKDDIYYDFDIEERIYSQLKRKLPIFSASKILSKRRINLEDGFYAPRAKMYVNIPKHEYIPEIFDTFLRKGLKMRYGFLSTKSINVRLVKPERYCKALPSIKDFDNDFWNKLNSIEKCMEYKLRLSDVYRLIYGEKIDESLWFVLKQNSRGKYFELYGSERMILLFCTFGLLDAELNSLFYPLPFK